MIKKAWIFLLATVLSLAASLSMTNYAGSSQAESQQTNYSGIYTCSGGRLHVLQKGNRLGFIAFRRGGGTYNNHIAQAEAWTTIQGNKAVHCEGSCTIKLTFLPGKALIKVSGKIDDCCFGVGASVAGDYKRVSSKTPDLRAMRKEADDHEMDTSLWVKISPLK